MKKIFIIVAIMACTAFGANAQEIGIRFGDSLGGEVALDAIFTMGEYSRLHADVSFGNGIGMEVLWDFLYKPVGDSGMKWYVGVGPSVRLADPFMLGVAGEVGLAYNFDFPLSLSADWRPTFVIIENTDLYTGGFGFNVRYVIGK